MKSYFLGVAILMLPYFPISKTPSVDKIALIQEKCEVLDAKGVLHGGILIAKTDSILYQKTFGFSKSNTENENHSHFNIASMGKMFTGVATMQLVAKGKLTLDTKIRDILPEFKENKGAQDITIHHLLTHTNGLPDVFMMGLGLDPLNPTQKTHAELVSILKDEKLKHKPGKKWRYTNSGYVMLGRIIEKLSGQSYCDYIRTNLLEPADMKSTGCGFGAGGAESTLMDMHKFSKALLTHELLPEEMTENMMEGKVELEKGVRYAYGFFDSNRLKSREVSHSGGVGEQIHCQLLMFVDTEYTVVIYSNNPLGFDAYHELRFMMRELLS